MFKQYKGNQGEQMGLGVTYWEKGSTKPIEKTLKGAKEIEKFLKEADSKGYIVS
jgi:hypothetical protein